MFRGRLSAMLSQIHDTTIRAKILEDAGDLAGSEGWQDPELMQMLIEERAAIVFGEMENGPTGPTGAAGP